MRRNLFSLNFKSMTGQELSINVGDTWTNSKGKQLTIQQIFAGDCSWFNILDVDGKFHKASDLVILEKRRMKTI